MDARKTMLKNLILQNDYLQTNLKDENFDWVNKMYNVFVIINFLST
jgi:hypothetical protein